MKRTTGEKIFNVFNIILMIGVIVTCLYPVYYTIVASVSNSDMLMAHRGILLTPLGMSFSAYEKIGQNSMVTTGFLNTFFVLITGVIINVLLTLLGGYFLSRKNVKWKNVFMVMVVITMYFNGGLVPTYLTVKSVGLENSLWSLIIPTAVNTFNLIIMRTGFQSIPDEMEEAARIDGAGHMTILFKICVPVIKATIAVILLYYAVGHWNSWFNASIYIKDRNLYPIQLVLREILIQSNTASMTTGVDSGDVESIAESIKYALIVVTTVPILCIYPFLQRFFEKGVMVGSVKG